MRLGCGRPHSWPSKTTASPSGVPDSHIFDMLTHRLYHDVRRALCDVMKRDVSLEFRVQHAPDPEAAGHSDDEMPLFQLLRGSKDRSLA